MKAISDEEEDGENLHIGLVKGRIGEGEENFEEDYDAGTREECLM